MHPKQRDQGIGTRARLEPRSHLTGAGDAA
jgi:hypothetical protein